MKDSQNITIALLLVSAAVLAGLLFVASYETKPAYAASPSRAGDYIMINGTISSSKDLIYVVDLAQGKLIAYIGDINANAMKPVDVIDLEKEFSKAAPKR